MAQIQYPYPLSLLKNHLEKLTEGRGETKIVRLVKSTDTGGEGRRVNNKEENRDYSLKSTQLPWLNGKPGLEPTGIQGRLPELHRKKRRKEIFQFFKSTLSFPRTKVSMESLPWKIT